VNIIKIKSEFKRWITDDFTEATVFSDRKSFIFEKMNCIPYDIRSPKELKVVRILWFIIWYEINNGR
jgi:hypothetical protein